MVFKLFFIVCISLFSSAVTASTTTYSYDAAGRLDSVGYQLNDGLVYTCQYNYDAYDNLLGRQVDTNILGDINESGGLDLADGILFLQILAGQHLEMSIPGYASIGDDQKAGLPEAIYVLDRLAR